MTGGCYWNPASHIMALTKFCKILYPTGTPENLISLTSLPRLGCRYKALARASLYALTDTFVIYFDWATIQILFAFISSGLPLLMAFVL